MLEARYEIRGASRADVAGLLDLSGHLDSVNLPHDRPAIELILQQSEGSFSEAIGDPRRREYVFVLYDRHDDRIVGTSMIIGQLGRRDAPYIYFDVATEERYSSTMDRHFAHLVLTIGYSYAGPTEIGGLVMHPAYRRVPERLGMQISYVRFLFMAMHRACFQEDVLAELLPPLEPDGKSHLWEAVGRRFTGMTYREADRLSKRNKEFIRGLFPDGDIYATLLSREAQDVIGKVGPQTRGVEKLLRRIGFRYANRVDPFDGGPHFIARTDDVTLIERSRQMRVRSGAASGRQKALVAGDSDNAPWFRALACPVELDGDVVTVPPAIVERLECRTDAPIWVLPLE